jgi:anti-anti-sigma regulatory factor
MKITANEEKKDKKSVQILLEGELVLSNCASAKKTFEEFLKKYTNFKLKLQNVEAIDLAFVQLIISFCDTAKNEKKHIKIEKQLSPDIEKTLNQTGVITFLEKYIES